jgi:hypothetical protein
MLRIAAINARRYLATRISYQIDVSDIEILAHIFIGAHRHRAASFDDPRLWLAAAPRGVCRRPR